MVNKMPSLVADVGGTHTRIASACQPQDARVFMNADFDSLEAVLAAWADSAGLSPRAAIAVAAPVHDGPITLTNLGWTFSRESLAGACGAKELLLVNDFAAVAACVPALTAADCLAIGGGRAVREAPALVLGPGTGLGTALLGPPGSGRLPPGHCLLPGEGGHASLAARDAREWAIVAALAQRHGRVSAERVLSGPGLVALYELLPDAGPIDPNIVTPAAVTAAAEAGRDRRAVAALALFFGWLGAFAGDLALAAGARAGVYLAGGILPRLADALLASEFRAAFEAKGRFAGWLAQVPVWLIRHPQPALLGLARMLAARP